jgi:hypothetical protein
MRTCSVRAGYYISLVLLWLGTGVLAAAGEGFIHTDRESPVVLAQPDATEAFSFAIFGDQTGTHDPVASLKVWEYAVGEMNLLGPDLVMTVGDMINGYNQQDAWMAEMKTFMHVTNTLSMPWFPVAGNHDVYWRGEDRPVHEHDGNYEQHFGPLWYAFEHKRCWFVVLYSDEGNPETGEKTFSKPESQRMSERQTAWLKDVLQQAQGAPHVFLFLHHPRWNGGRYGEDWQRVHGLLKAAGNVSAVFAGHTHTMKFNGERDGIAYYTLGTTGGAIPEHNAPRGRLHHYDWVTVRGDDLYVAAFPVGSAINPRMNPIKTLVLIPWEQWLINSDASRLLNWSVAVPDFEGVRGELRVGVSHALDDTGDEGVYYSLMNAQQRPLSSGFLNGKGTQWVKVAVEPGQRLFFTLSDHDTLLAGEHAGNGGRIQIELDVILHEFKDPTRR